MICDAQAESRLFADPEPSLSADQYKWMYLEVLARGPDRLNASSAPLISKEGMARVLTSGREYIAELAATCVDVEA